MTALDPHYPLQAMQPLTSHAETTLIPGYLLSNDGRQNYYFTTDSVIINNNWGCWGNCYNHGNCTISNAYDDRRTLSRCTCDAAYNIYASNCDQLVPPTKYKDNNNPTTSSLPVGDGVKEQYPYTVAFFALIFLFLY